MVTLPLRYRLPNPPADFVGRQEEVSSLAASLREVRVTVLVGPGGVGKTALALHTLHKRFPKRVSQTLYVSVTGQLDGSDLRRELLRALAAASDTEIGWSQLRDDPDSLVEAILDLAEANSLWVFLDDLEHAPPEEADALLEALSRYARNSRYLAASRGAPRPGRLASGRVLQVGGLDEESVLQLARLLGEGRSPQELTAAARACGGSPWLLQEALLSGVEVGGSRPPSHETLLEGLSDSARSAAMVLSRVEVPIPPAALDAAGVTEEQWRHELSLRGWIQETPAGVRLHEVARHGITAGGDALAPADVWLPVALELAGSAAPTLRLEGIRLLVEANALDPAERILDESLPALLAEGYAPQLWKLLDRVPPERFGGVRLRCAAELGNPTVLRQLSQPLEGSTSDRLTWAETLYMRGDLSGALDVIAALLADSSAEAQACRIDAELLRARLLLAQDRIDEARELLESLTPSSPAEATRRSVLLLATAPVRRDDDAERHAALATLAGLEQRTQELRDRVRSRIRFHLALAYLRWDALDAAEAAVDTPPPGDSEDTLALFEARRATWLLAMVDLARGRLAAARERLDQLEPFLSSPSLLRSEVQCTQARLWMASGDFAGLVPLLEEARREAEALGSWATAHRCERIRARVDELLLAPGALQSRARACRRLLQDPETSARELERAVLRATTTGHRVRAAERRAEYCACLLLLGRSADLEREVAELRKEAEEMGSTRWAHEADLLGMFGALDWALLESIAQATSASPIAARRARALLQPDAGDPLDPLDLAVVERLRGHDTVELVVPAAAGESWQSGWGLDVSRRRVWLPTGEWLDLTRRGLLARLLLALARHGGSASKEELVEAVWDEPEYHPLRHDTRLQVTVHKCRELLEQDAGAPRLLVTTATGYALTGPFRLVSNDELDERVDSTRRPPVERTS